MAKFSNIRPLTQLFVLCTIGILSLGGSQDLVLRKTNTPKSETREDLRCGEGYNAPNGLPAVFGKALPYLSNFVYGLIKNTFSQLVFPNLVVLRSSIANNHIKVFHFKYSRNSEDIRRRERMSRNEVEDGLFHEENTGASAEPQVSFKGRGRAKFSRARASGALTDL